MVVTDDQIAEDPQSMRLQVRASVLSTPISQILETRVTILDNEGIIERPFFTWLHAKAI